MLRLPTENTSDREENIMAEWQAVRLGEIVKTNQSTYSPKENWQFVNYLDTGNITMNKIDEIQNINTAKDKLPSRARRKVKTNSIIYSTVRPNQLHYGIIKEQPDNFLVSTGFTVIDVNYDKAVPDFIYYALTKQEVTEQLQAIAEQSVSAYPSLKPSDIENLELMLPDKKTQERIVAILRSIDEKIKENNAINNNLEQQYISIVDNLLSKLTQYKIYSLLEVADCQNGRAFYKEGYDPNGAFVIDLGNVNTSGNFVRTAADKYISLDRYKEPKLEKYRVYKNDIVMVMTDRKSTMELLGKVGKIYKDGYYLLNQRMYRIRAKEGINTNYLYACLNSTETSNFLKRKALGSVQKYVNTGEINSIEIKVPSSEKMEEIASILDPIFLQMESNILENESLNELRDILLPKLMSGELDVSGIDL